MPALLRQRQPLLFQPVEQLTMFSFARVVEETRAVWFPQVTDEIEVRVMAMPPLAAQFEHAMGFGRHAIAFHAVLNRPDMPEEVVRFIVKHELTHIVHPPLYAKGALYIHPPSFWEHELEVGPERFAVWAWLHANMGPILLETRWGLRVPRTWRKRAPARLAPYTPHLPFDDAPWHVLCPEGGAQLRFEPSWAVLPRPFEPSETAQRGFAVGSRLSTLSP